MGKEFSDYQKKVIGDYYKNQGSIALAALQALVSEIYLAESPAKKERLWQKVEAYLKKLKIPEAIVRHIIEKRDVQILAKNLNDWLHRCNV